MQIDREEMVRQIREATKSIPPISKAAWQAIFRALTRERKRLRLLAEDVAKNCPAMLEDSPELRSFITQTNDKIGQISRILGVIGDRGRNMTIHGVKGHVTPVDTEGLPHEIKGQNVDGASLLYSVAIDRLATLGPREAVRRQIEERISAALDVAVKDPELRDVARLTEPARVIIDGTQQATPPAWEISVWLRPLKPASSTTLDLTTISVNQESCR